MNFISKIFNWVFGDDTPKERRYELDHLENSPMPGRTMIIVMDNPCLAHRVNPVDLQSDTSSVYSLVSYTKEETKFAEKRGVVRPNSRLKLKYKIKKR